MDKASGQPPLSAEEQSALWQQICAWRVDRSKAVSCPRCHTDRVSVEDRSARPYTEWYAVQCPQCGLEHNINIALGASPPGGYG